MKLEYILIVREGFRSDLRSERFNAGCPISDQNCDVLVFQCVEDAHLFAREAWGYDWYDRVTIREIGHTR